MQMRFIKTKKRAPFYLLREIVCTPPAPEHSYASSLSGPSFESRINAIAPTMNDGLSIRRKSWRIQPGNGTSRQMRSNARRRRDDAYEDIRLTATIEKI